jgi:hypothetical protein
MVVQQQEYIYKIPQGPNLKHATKVLALYRLFTGTSRFVLCACVLY